MEDRILGFDSQMWIQSVWLVLNTTLWILIILFVIWIAVRWSRKSKRVDRLEKEVQNLKSQVEEIKENR